MSGTKRRWWIVAQLTGRGTPDEVYHHVERPGLLQRAAGHRHKTACGVELPEVCMFLVANADSPADRLRKRCKPCLEALKVRP